MTSLEKAARAVEEQLSDAFFDGRNPDPAKIARAVLMAVREPDEALCDLASDAANEATPDRHDFWCMTEMVSAGHTAMIDAILADQPKGDE